MVFSLFSSLNVLLFPLLFKQRFEALPEIAKYLAKRRKYPVFAERAFVGGSGKPAN